MASAATWILLALALAAAVVVLVEAIRRPILFRMAARNTRRRPRQTATVILGLMIGTAIISASIVAGQSAGQAIRGAVYEALGHVDETVRLDSFVFYDDVVLEEYLADPDITSFFDGIAPNVIWGVAAENEATDLFEPRAIAVGFEPEADADFREFHLTDGTTWDGRGLGTGEAIVTQRLADAIELDTGDTITLRYTQPLDPLLPDIFPLQGSLTSVGGGIALPGVPVPTTPASDSYSVDVRAGAERLVSIVGWDPTVASPAPPTTQMSIRLESPDGTLYSSRTVADGPGPVLPPLWLNVTEPAVGTWTLTVASPFAVEAEYAGAALVLYPVYDPAELAKKSRELQNVDAGPFQDLVDAASGFGEPETMQLQVRAITDGGRGEQFDFHEAVFFRIEEAQEAFGREGEINVLKFSNPGDIITGRDSTDEAVQRLNATLERIKAEYPDDGAIQNLEIRPVKDQFVQLADDSGQLMTSLLLFAGSLSVITGLLLIINIFTMLGEERRSELGMARAVGMTRKDLIRVFLFEGSLYGVAAAAVGTFVGLGLAAIMVAFMNRIMNQLGAEIPAIPLKVTADALLIAFAAGTLLTFLTIFFTSRRISRLNIVRAIRRIDEPDRRGSRMMSNIGIGLAGIGLTALALGWLTHVPFNFSMKIFGGLFVAVGVAMALLPHARKRHILPPAAAGLAVYYIIAIFTVTRFDDIDEANVVGPIRGVLLTLCVVILVSFWEGGPRLFGRILARTKRLRAIALPAIAYPLHKRFRTGMTLAMFSIVILAIGFFSIFGGLFDQDPDGQTGGFDIEASTTLDVTDISEYDRGLLPPGLVESTVRVDSFFTPDAGIITVSDERTGQFTARIGHYIFGIDQEFVDAPAFRLLWRSEEYATDADAYEAVLARDDVVIVAYQYSTDEGGQDLSHEVGETLQLHLGDQPEEFTIIGIQEQWHFPGIFLSKERVGGLFPTSTDGFYLFKTAEGTDNVEAAKLLERNYRDAGLNAEASREKVLEEQEAIRQVLGAMKLFLGLGLLVGVLSLGIVTARSVIERRQEIGMLRALGYTPGMVRRLFFIEVTATVLAGAIIGLVCSIIVSFGLWFAIIRELNYPYEIPWGEITVLVVVAYVVALMATFVPIGRAARVAPAEALRYLE